MRAELLTAITSQISTLTQFSVSQELPWSQNGQSLFRKNMKKVYVDNASVEQTVLFPVLSGSDVFADLYTIPVYVVVDAKNPPSQTASMVSKILQARDSAAITAYDKEADYVVENDEDVTIYTFEFRFGVAT
jgi:hypothetical protein